jgi:hypothetical protein
VAARTRRVLEAIDRGDPLPITPLAEASEAPPPTAGVVPVVALGLLGAPFILGVAGVSLLGEALAANDARSLSARPHIALATAALPLAMLAWLPAPIAFALSIGGTLALMPLAYVPALLVDPRTTWARAVARSIDLTARADVRGHRSALGLAAPLALLPGIFATLWALLEPVAHANILRALTLAPIALVLALAGAFAAWRAISDLARGTSHPAAHERPASLRGASLVGVLAVAVVWGGATPAVVARHGLEMGPWLAAVSVPVSLVGTPNGPMLVMARDDGGQFGVLARLDASPGIEAVDALSAQQGYVVPTPNADVRVALSHLSVMGAMGLTLFALGLYSLVRGRHASSRLARSTVVRVRAANEDVVRGMGDRGVVPAGSSLTVLADHGIVRLAYDVPVTRLDPNAEGPFEASVVARGAWWRASTYRGDPPTPPADAQMIAGDVGAALAAARLQDLERVVKALALVAPVAWALALVIP